MDFSATPQSGPAPLLVTFNDTSTHTPTAWSWDFGDGGTSREQHPLHTYTDTGTYTVRLTAMNIRGSDTMEKPGYVTVGPVVTVTPTPTVTPVEPGVYTYSITDELNSPASQKNRENMQYKLVTENKWTEKFSETGKSVTKSHFGVNSQPGGKTLNSAMLHYHVGHGYSYPDGSDSYLELLDQENMPTIKLKPPEVEGKWGGNNKWVILSSCYVLRDDRWGKALGTSHGILGFKTMAYIHPEFTQEFFKYAIDEEKTVYDSFRYTTYTVMKDDWVPINPWDKNSPKEMTVAAVYFKNQSQAKYDFLPGIKTGVYSDANPTDKPYDKDWPCNKPPQEG